MIKSLEMNNVKSIRKLTIPCEKLNLLIGTNSSGKSTVIQSLLVLAQNEAVPCGLNGDLIQLGTFEENRCCYSGDMEISVFAQGEQNRRFSVVIQKSDEWNKLRLKKSQEMPEYFDFKNRNFQYLSCNRIGPKNIYEKNLAIEETIGINGEYAMSYLNAHGQDPIDSALCRYEDDYTLLAQVNWWLNYIMDTEITTEEIPGADVIRASYRMYDMLNIRPVNIGSGVSYLVSILIMCLSAPAGGILVIENPEIHLHPAAQSKVCEFLYFVSQSGRQLFIESHSDHIFNGFRAGIVTKEMIKEDINMQFLFITPERTTDAIRVEIDSYGNVENQKENLFDQFDLDLNRMLGL